MASALCARAASSLASVSGHIGCAAPFMPAKLSLGGRARLARHVPHATEPAKDVPQKPAQPEPLPLPEEGLTTWRYGKMKEPGLAPWYVAAMFVPFLGLLLLPLISLPAMPSL